MSSTSSQRQRVVLIDEEWAATLVGLPMAVPNSWWQGYKRDDDTLNAGTIVGVDFDQPNSKYLQLESGDKIYAMRYDAVYQYVDMDHANYDAAKFHLPLSAPANPEHEGGVRIAPQKKKKPFGGTMRMMTTMRMRVAITSPKLRYTAKTQQETRRSQTTAQKK
jgi:hypothetical protein